MTSHSPCYSILSIVQENAQTMSSRCLPSRCCSWQRSCLSLGRRLQVNVCFQVTCNACPLFCTHTHSCILKDSAHIFCLTAFVRTYTHTHNTLIHNSQYYHTHSLSFTQRRHHNATHQQAWHGRPLDHRCTSLHHIPAP